MKKTSYAIMLFVLFSTSLTEAIGSHAGRSAARLYKKVVAYKTARNPYRTNRPPVAKSQPITSPTDLTASVSGPKIPPAPNNPAHSSSQHQGSTGSSEQSFSHLEKNFFGASIASFVAFLGFNAAVHNNNSVQPVTVPETQEEQTSASSQHVEEVTTQQADTQSSDIYNFFMTHGYTNPHDAIMNVYNEPNTSTMFNLLTDPVIATTVITATLIGYKAYYSTQSTNISPEHTDQIQE